MRIDSGCNSAQKGAARLAGLGVQVKEMLGGIEYWLRAPAARDSAAWRGGRSGERRERETVLG